MKTHFSQYPKPQSLLLSFLRIHLKYQRTSNASAWKRVICCGFYSALCLLSARADQIILRNGGVLTGQIQRTTSDYLLNTGNGKIARFKKQEVRNLIYDNPELASRELRLTQTAAAFGCSSELKTVCMLPAEAFGQAICDAARTAKESIYISQFLISGAEAEAISKFYVALKACASAGIKVVVIVEYGPRTPAAVKFKSFEYGQELEAAGVTTYYNPDTHVLHKKMMLVDDKKLILGSSNLTLAGVLENNEMNFMIEDAKLAGEVKSDFNKLILQSLTRAQVYAREILKQR